MGCPLGDVCLFEEITLSLWTTLRSTTDATTKSARYQSPRVPPSVPAAPEFLTVYLQNGQHPAPVAACVTIALLKITVSTNAAINDNLVFMVSLFGVERFIPLVN